MGSGSFPSPRPMHSVPWASRNSAFFGSDTTCRQREACSGGSASLACKPSAQWACKSGSRTGPSHRLLTLAAALRKGVLAMLVHGRGSASRLRHRLSSSSSGFGQLKTPSCCSSPAHLSQRCSAEYVNQHAHCRAAVCSGQCKAQFHPVQKSSGRPYGLPMQSGSLVQETPVTCRPNPPKSMLPRPPQVKCRHVRPRPCQKAVGRFSRHLKEQTTAGGEGLLLPNHDPGWLAL